ncbi:hypothetical protein EDF74_2126 [Stenotrophomonas rhizophila]|uniref:hypothetical protein n=1 Tax=Stenotrophomonas TaxID=40323 RepID=UPI000FB0E9F8|nr:MULTISPECIES: hypothetical protein [Stenotrophomonas]MCW6027900.1 hypothetical protein [Stenotrophomonas sp. SRS1]ROP76472.1 hypothetical protein EDF74_2126 [Stenotrophomonas rhizophila]
MSSDVMTPERPPAGPQIAPCPVATQAQHLLAHLQFSQVSARALSRLPVDADLAIAAPTV